MINLLKADSCNQCKIPYKVSVLRRVSGAIGFYFYAIVTPVISRNFKTIPCFFLHDSVQFHATEFCFLETLLPIVSVEVNISI